MKLLCCFILICLLACLPAPRIHHQSLPKEEGMSIKLKWYKAYPTENQQRVEVGLKWILSYLGAMLPTAAADKNMVWEEDNVLKLDIAAVGFSTEALKVWKKLLPILKKSKEYQRNGHMDIGRFVLLTFNSSWHYYAITGAAPTLKDFEKKYNLQEKNKVFLLPGESCVTSGIRTLNSSIGNTLKQMSHIAEEGEGQQLEGFEVTDFEVFDFMDNGQLRFAVYDIDGQLKTGADPLITKAGKPAKCMWCHESQVSRPIQLIKKKSPKLKEFKQLVKKQNDFLKKYRNELIPSLDTFRNIQKQHYLAELLYLTYLEPTKNRAIEELKQANISPKNLSLNMTDSVHHEFYFLKEIVALDSLAKWLPYDRTWKGDARETTENELNFLK